jgi:hypothetical protein
VIKIKVKKGDLLLIVKSRHYTETLMYVLVLEVRDKYHPDLAFKINEIPDISDIEKIQHRQTMYKIMESKTGEITWISPNDVIKILA